jgi:hypothetical protein
MDLLLYLALFGDSMRSREVIRYMMGAGSSISRRLIALLEVTDFAEPVSGPIMVQASTVLVHPRFFNLRTNSSPMARPKPNSNEPLATMPYVLPIDVELAMCRLCLVIMSRVCGSLVASEGRSFNI